MNGQLLACYLILAALNLQPCLADETKPDSPYGADQFPGAPKAPEGYASELLVKAAFALGQLKTVEFPTEIPNSIQEYKDIEYANVDGHSLKLNLYVPKDIVRPTPCLVFIHGGGWSKGKREDYLIYNLAFAERGYITASVSYRLSKVAKFPAAVQDVKSAIRWLRANADKYKIDANKMAAIGGSAGGHLALMAGMSTAKELEGPGNAQQSSRVQAVVNFYGVTDMTTDRARNAEQVQSFLGGTYEELKHQYLLSSPMEHLTKDDPPVLTFHGSIDELVPVSQASRLHKALDEAGIENSLDILVGWPHTMDLQADINERCQYIASAFLMKHLPLPKR